MVKNGKESLEVVRNLQNTSQMKRRLKWSWKWKLKWCNSVFDLLRRNLRSVLVMSSLFLTRIIFSVIIGKQLPIMMKNRKRLSKRGSVGYVMDCSKRQMMRFWWSWMMSRTLMRMEWVSLAKNIILLKKAQIYRMTSNTVLIASIHSNFSCG